MDKLDAETIDTLKEVLGDEFGLLMETFLEDVPVKLKQLNEAVQQNDVEALERLAHTLKGSSGNIGAHALSSACATMVNACRQKDTEQAAGQLDSIIAEFEAVRPALEALKT